jgi:hypothetical protein
MPSYYYQATSGTSRLINWQDFVYPYVKSVQVFGCPSAKNRPSATTPVAANYSYNPYVSAAVKTIYGLGSWTLTQPLKLSQVQNSAEGMLLMDYQSNYGFYLPRQEYAGRAFYNEIYIHFDGDNAAYIDGHVKWRKTSTDASIQNNDKPYWDPT